VEPTRERWYRRRIAELERQLRERDERIAVLERQVTQLVEQVARLSKNSSNSSKPPSSDIVKPPKPKPKGKRKRKIGGQPGHPKHEREPFPRDQVNRVRTYRLNGCPDCGGRLKRLRTAPRTIQQVEIIERPIQIVEHRGERYWCRHCQKEHTARLPRHVVKGGLAGPNLTALVAYLKGVCHASFSTIRKFFRDVLKLTISRGELAKLIRKAGSALAGAYQELRDRLPFEHRLNVDETGHKENGKGLWTWCFRAEMFTLFKIDPSRGSNVLIDMLGKEFNGVLGCDYFSAYRKYMKDFGVHVQFCLAHLIRDVKFLLTLPDKVPSARRDDTSAVSASVRAGTLQGAGHQLASPAAIGSPEPGRTVSQARRRLLPVHHHAGHRTNEQLGRAGDPVRGDRPANHAGHTKRARPTVERTHLDGHRHVQSTTPFRLRLPP